MLNSEIEGYSPVDGEDMPWIDDSSFEADRNEPQQRLRAPTYIRTALTALILLLCGTIVDYNMQAHLTGCVPTTQTRECVGERVPLIELAPELTVSRHLMKLILEDIPNYRKVHSSVSLHKFCQYFVEASDRAPGNCRKVPHTPDGWVECKGCDLISPSPWSSPSSPLLFHQFPPLMSNAILRLVPNRSPASSYFPFPPFSSTTFLNLLCSARKSPRSRGQCRETNLKLLLQSCFHHSHLR
jgi:hypothetical protein